METIKTTRLFCTVYFMGFDIEKTDDFYNKKYQRYLLSFFTDETPTIGHEKVFLRRTLNTVNTFLISQINFKQETICTIYKDYLETKIKFINTQPQQPAPEATYLKETDYLGQPINENANKLFDYLIEYYRPTEKTVVKYVNILHFLKNDAEKKHFIFAIKQDDYKILVQGKTGIVIKKFAKSEQYNEVEKPIFYSLENTFLKNMTV